MADAGNARVQKFSPSGQLLQKIGGWTQVGQEWKPGIFGSGVTDVAIGSNGNIWVTNAWRVSQFTPAGEHVGTFGSAGTGQGQFKNSASGIAVDNAGNVWVIDGEGNRVIGFRESGAPFTQFGTGTYGGGTEEFRFSTWNGIAVDPKGNIAVTDHGNQRVQRWWRP